MNKIYICIDLKSFYASVECVYRGLDPLKTNLVVADTSRTEKTICLAVSPSLKKLGISSRPRLFEVIEGVKQINAKRRKDIHYKPFKKKSYISSDLADPYTEVDYIAATPQMKKYIEVSTKIYSIYLKYIDPTDIHVYSIDEAFMDITNYMKLYKMSPEELVRKIILDIYQETGITATGGIGTNMYLAKIAMDIEAKKKEADEYGVRVAFLDEYSYKKSLWGHTPITDFWRVGKGIASRLERLGCYTMGDVARLAIQNEEILFDEFGVNAEILIDHAFGLETVGILDIKAYKPEVTSLTVGQVIHCPYEYDKALIVVKEMTYELYEKLLSKHMLTNQIGLSIGYDIDQVNYDGEYDTDYLDRKIPKGVHTTINLTDYTNSFKEMKEAVVKLFSQVCNKNLFVRRLFVVATHTIPEENYKKRAPRLTLFDDPLEVQKNEAMKEKFKEKEKNVESVILDLKKRFGANSVVKAIDLDEAGTTLARNKEIGGHKA